MYTFLSSDNENGIFDDLGFNVKYFDSGKSDVRFEKGFPDGKHILMVDYGGWDLDKYLAAKMFQRYYKYNPQTGEKEELFTKWEDRGQLGSIIILSDERFIVVQDIPGKRKVYIVDFHGEERTLFLNLGDAVLYGTDLSPDKSKISFHVTGGDKEFCPKGCHYAINVIDVDGKNRRLVYAKPGHLMFGTRWTYDGKYIVFNDCYSENDPAHFFADICLASPDGHTIRYLTENQRSYFGTAYGTKEDYKGRGSNYPIPMPNGMVMYTYRTQGAHPDTEYRAERGNHREAVFAPENARGGAYLVMHDLETDERIQVTPYEEGKWDFRPVITPDGQHVIYTTVRTASKAEIHICNLDGTQDRLITRGHNDSGADHVGYIPCN